MSATAPAEDATRQANRAVVQAVLETITSGEFEKLADYVTDDLVFELPYGPAFMPNPVHGRDAWNQMQLMTFKMFSSFKQTLLHIHDGLDPDRLVAEYQSNAVVASNGKDYINRYIGVFQFRDRKISEWREYHNPDATRVIGE